MAKTTDTTTDKADTPAVPDTAPAQTAPEPPVLFKVEITKHGTHVGGLIFASGAYAKCDKATAYALVAQNCARIVGV